MSEVSRKSRRKFIIGGVIVAGCIVALVAATTGMSLDFYSTVGEFIPKAELGKTGLVRVRGIVVEGSVRHDAAKLDTEFAMSDGKASLPVFYHGVLPSTFEPGRDIVVQGTYNAARKTLVASQLMFKCPSKYESKKGTY